MFQTAFFPICPFRSTRAAYPDRRTARRRRFDKISELHTLFKRVFQAAAQAFDFAVVAALRQNNSLFGKMVTQNVQRIGAVHAFRAFGGTAVFATQPPSV